MRYELTGDETMMIFLLATYLVTWTPPPDQPGKPQPDWYWVSLCTHHAALQPDLASCILIPDAGGSYEHTALQAPVEAEMGEVAYFCVRSGIHTGGTARVSEPVCVGRTSHRIKGAIERDSLKAADLARRILFNFTTGGIRPGSREGLIRHVEAVLQEAP